MFTLLEFLFQGFFEWVYSLILEIWNFFASSLLNVMTLDFAYIKSHIPVVADISQVLLAVGWALLLGNLVFQALRGMVAGLGFEGEDPKLLFARTFVFGFLLLASPQICETVLTITSRVITLLEIPDAINVHLVDDSVFGVLGASWILVIIFDVITMFMVLSLLLEVAERYMVLAMLTVMAPLAFAMGGSKSTSEIFTGWCRMFGSMCFLMATNIVFFKMLLSVVSTVPSFPDVFLWMVLIVSIVKVAKKADEIITRIGLNPAITGNKSTLPGVLAYTVFRTALSMATKGAANGIGGALGIAGKGATGAGKSAVGFGKRTAGAAFRGTGRAAAGAAGAAGVAGAAAGAVGGIGGAVAGAAGQRSDGPRYGGGRQQNQQSNSQQEYTASQQTQQSTSRTQAGSQQQNTATSRTQTNSQQQTTTQGHTTNGRITGPQGPGQTGRSSRKSSVPQGTRRGTGFVSPPSSQVQTEEKSTFRSSSSASREGSFSGIGRSGGVFTGDGSRSGGFSSAGQSGGGFSGSRTEMSSTTTAQENQTRSGFGGAGVSKDTPRGGGTFGGCPSGTTKNGGFGGSFGTAPRSGSFGGADAPKSAPRGETFGGRPSGATRSGGFGRTSSSSTTQSTSQENISKTAKTSQNQPGTAGTGQSTASTKRPAAQQGQRITPTTPKTTTVSGSSAQPGTAKTQTRSSQRPPAYAPRHSRNEPPATAQSSTGVQKSGPVQQEQRRPGSPLKPQAMPTAGGPQPDMAGTQARSSQRPTASGPRHSRNRPPATAQSSTGTQKSGPTQQEQRRPGSPLKPQAMSTAGSSQTGTAGTQARSSQRPSGSEPRHSRNGPASTTPSSSGAQMARPARQEQRKADRKAQPQVKDKSPRSGTAGTGTGPRTPPSQKLSGGPASQPPTRQTKREGEPTDV